jgi:antitoxin CcdA
MLRQQKSLKRPTNLSLDAGVLDMARELGLNISRTVDELLAQEVQRLYWARWNEDNKQAIATYNARVEKDGLPLAKYRSFLKGR